MFYFSRETTPDLFPSPLEKTNELKALQKRRKELKKLLLQVFLSRYVNWVLAFLVDDQVGVFRHQDPWQTALAEWQASANKAPATSAAPAPAPAAPDKERADVLTRASAEKTIASWISIAAEAKRRDWRAFWATAAAEVKRQTTAPDHRG
jgi:hypothetical protein